MLFRVTAYHERAGQDVKLTVTAASEAAAWTVFLRYCLQPEMMQLREVIEAPRGAKHTTRLPYR